MKKILITEKEKNIKFSFLFHNFNRYDKYNIWIFNLGFMASTITNSHYKHKKCGPYKFKILFQYSSRRPEKSNIVLATMTITCCSADRNNCKIYNTTSIPFREPALHTPTQRSL